MRNKIPGLLTSSKIHETINLKPAGDVVMEITNTKQAKSKDEDGGGGEEEARRRRLGGGRGDEEETGRRSAAEPP